MDILASSAKILLLPPTSLYLVGLLGWLLLWRRPGIGRSLLALSGGLLIALSLPVLAHPLYDSLSSYPPLKVSGAAEAKGAIVILAAESRWAEEYGGEIPGAHSFVRLRYGARLHKQLQLPILIAGGSPEKGRKAVAALMAESLEEDFGVTARWQETNSVNTYENALFATEILRNHSIRRAYLVTHAAHMSRARAAFEALGIRVIAAPVSVPPSDHTLSYRDFLPSAHALGTSAAAIYEYLGRVWYSILSQFPLKTR